MHYTIEFFLVEIKKVNLCFLVFVYQCQAFPDQANPSPQLKLEVRRQNKQLPIKVFFSNTLVARGSMFSATSVVDQWYYNYLRCYEPKKLIVTSNRMTAIKPLVLSLKGAQGSFFKVCEH